MTWMNATKPDDRDSGAMNRDDATSARTAHALERIATTLRTVLLLAVLGIILWLFIDVLLLIFAASLLALGLRGGASRISQVTRLPITAALALEVVLLAGLLAAAAWWSGPRLAAEAVQLKQQLVEQWGHLRGWLETTSWGNPLLEQLPASLGGNPDGSSGFPSGLAGKIAGALSSALGVFGTVILILAAAIYFALSPTPYVEGPLHLLPRRARGDARNNLHEIGRTLQYWLAGQLLDMVVVGVVTGAGLALLGVNLAFVLGVLAGLLNFVPYIGAIGGAVPAILIALAQGPQQALYVTILFVVVQGLEGNVLSPLIQRRAVDLPPAATILAQTAFGALFGLAGIILATPIAAAILTALREITAERGDDGVGLEG